MNVYQRCLNTFFFHIECPDGSVMKYLNYSIPNPKLYIYTQHNWNCKVQNKFKFSQDGQGWTEDNSGLPLTISRINMYIRELKVNISKKISKYHHKCKCLFKYVPN